MPSFNLPNVSTGADTKQLANTIGIMSKELRYLLEHLDEKNVIRAGSVYAENIDTKNAKIGTAQIETGIFMEPGSAIAWSQISDPPSIPSAYSDAQALAAWAASGYATYIDAYGMYSGTFTGGLFRINPNAPTVGNTGIQFGGYSGGTWYDDVANFYYRNSDIPALILNDGGFGTTFYNYLDTEFHGAVDFSGATSINWGAFTPGGIATFG